MFKKITITLLVALFLCSVLSAAGTSEESQLLRKAAANYVQYKPSTRSALLEKLDLNGAIIKEANAKASYQWGRTAKRVLEGDESIFKLLDSTYDGILYTPHVDSTSYEYVGDQNIDGKVIAIYETEIEADIAEFFYDAIGTGDVQEREYVIGIDRESANINYQIAKYSANGYDVVQTAYFSDGVPHTIITELYKDSINSIAFIHDIENLKITETLSY